MSRKEKQEVQHPQVEQHPVDLPGQWRIENQEVFQYLDEGRSVREIASLVGRSERQVKAVKKQLDDLHTARLSLQDILNLLTYLPHPRVERPPEVREAFNRFLREIGEEPPNESTPMMPDASSEHDKYIYG